MISNKDLLFQLGLKEEELLGRIKYCEKKRNLPCSFDQEVEWDCKRLDAEKELGDIREKIEDIKNDK